MGDRHGNHLRPLASTLVAGALMLLTSLVGAPAGAAGAPLSLSISGNRFVNGSGQPIRLLGVNHPSSEYACVDGFGYDDGHMDGADAAAIASWNANAVRIPLNEDCWLGINGQPNNSEEPGVTFTAAGYRQAVETYVADLHAHGLYAILDLHWSAPGGGVANGQQPMPDVDHSPAFWQSVAQTFKGDPAVVFDVFNEPFDPTDPRSGEDADQAHKVSWECWEKGHCATDAYNDGVPTGSTYQVAGMQELVDSIRGTGATQPVMVGGLDFANDLSQWVSHAPEDPLGQEAASFHNYMGKTCEDVTCWNSEIAPVAADVPVVTGEFDEDDYAESKCATRTPSSFDQDYMSWADQHGVGYLAWGWLVLSQQEKDAEGCSAFYLIEDYGGTPAFPNGTALHDHLLSLPPGGLTTTAPAPGNAPAPAAPSSSAGGAGGTPSLTLRSFGAKVRRGGSRVAFTLRSAQSCSGVLSARTLSSYAVPGVRRKRRRVSLGTIHFTLTAGRTKTVVLTLSKASRRLLLAKHALKAQITVDLASSGFRTTAFTRTLVLKVPAASGHAGR